MKKEKTTSLPPIYFIYDKRERDIVDEATPSAGIQNRVFTSYDEIQDAISQLLSEPNNCGRVYYILKSIAIIERQILPVEIIKFDEVNE
jgi:hypothetical protein